jgi:hypothetical protein
MLPTLERGRYPAGRCARCRCRVPGVFLQCHRCKGHVIVSTDTRDGEFPQLLLKVLGVTAQ